MRYRVLQAVFLLLGLLVSVAVLKPSLLFRFTSTDRIHFAGVQLLLIPLDTVCFILALWASNKSKNED